jgi:hypothetical protein
MLKNRTPATIRLAARQFAEKRAYTRRTTIEKFFNDDCEARVFDHLSIRVLNAIERLANTRKVDSSSITIGDMFGISAGALRENGLGAGVKVLACIDGLKLGVEVNERKVSQEPAAEAKPIPKEVPKPVQLRADIVGTTPQIPLLVEQVESMKKMQDLMAQLKTSVTTQPARTFSEGVEALRDTLTEMFLSESINEPVIPAEIYLRTMKVLYAAQKRVLGR